MNTLGQLTTKLTNQGIANQSLSEYNKVYKHLIGTGVIKLYIRISHYLFRETTQFE